MAKEEKAKMEAGAKAKGDAQNANPTKVDPCSDPNVKKVKVHFLVDYRIGEREYKCNEFAMISELIAKSICDKSSVEYAQ